jgi:N-acetylmuramoyl-L-alanine amidase
VATDGVITLKYKIIFVFSLVCLVFNSLFAAPLSPFSLPVGTIVLDAGHGGEDPGAVAAWSLDEEINLIEKEINLEITLKVAALLKEKTDITVLFTRQTDVFIPLSDRAAVSSLHNPGINKKTIFVSIHVNSSNSPLAHGFELFVKQSPKKISFLNSESSIWALSRYANFSNSQLNALLNRENLILAAYVEESLKNSFPQSRSRGVKEQDLWVLNQSKVPSVLIEVGFISNLEEAYLMAQESWRQKMAEAITEGLLNYINQS